MTLYSVNTKLWVLHYCLVCGQVLYYSRKDCWQDYGIHGDPWDLLWTRRPTTPADGHLIDF
jgi:hypothetical protein